VHYIRPKKLLTGLGLLLMATLLLVACGADTPAEPAATPISEVAQVAPTALEPATVAPPTAESEQPTDTPMPAPTEALLATDTASAPTDTVAPPTDTPEPAPAVVSTFGQTEDGLYFRGNPDPTAVTVIDYSDFL